MEAIRTYRELVDTSLSGLVAKLEEANPVKNHINYALFPAGKRIRPLLTLASYELYSSNSDEILALALSIELIHNYSLVHDDLPAMDDDDYRRGKLSLHRKFGEAEAILAGDSLLNMSMENALEDLDQEEDPGRLRRKIHAYKLVYNSSGSQGMILGQVLDIGSDEGLLSKGEIEKMYSLKTSCLFKAAIVSAGIVGGAGKEELDILNDFSMNFGMFFQITDDIDDYEKDMEDGKQTLISHMEKKEASELAEKYYRLAKDNLKTLADDYNRQVSSLRAILSLVMGS